MLRYLYADDLTYFPKLQDTMFRDRTATFRDRLGWPVDVDHRGWERDIYDSHNPLYVIWQAPDGSHLGSMRFLPTIGRTSYHFRHGWHFDHFSHLLPRRIEARDIWECTRFCLSRHAGPDVAPALMLGAAELGSGLALSRAVGVFDARMERVYRRLGWCPDIIGQNGSGRSAISVGLWRFSEGQRLRLAAKSGISAHLSRLWFSRAFGARVRLSAVC